MRGWIVLVVAVGLGLVRPAAAADGPDLVAYDSKYYTIHTDLGPDVAREAAVRMTHMADEYRTRTRDFAGTVRGKFDFYLYGSAADYLAAGGIKGSSGVFMADDDHGRGAGGRLMAVAGRRPAASAWHTVQHEGFHQFAHAAIGRQLPTWLNEGLADYFAEGLYTGDDFVTGVVPPWRLARVKKQITAGTFRPLVGLLAVSPEQWQAEMTMANYDQAWSTVHFLIHADGGRYAPALARCVRDLAIGRPFDAAWADAVGPTDGFEDRYRAYWLGLPASPTADLYDRATVATLTSFLARATAQRQTFPTPAAFATAGLDGKLKAAPDDWLPRSLLDNVLRTAWIGTRPPAGARMPVDDGTIDVAPRLTDWQLVPGPDRLPTLSARTADGKRLVGWFRLAGSRVATVGVDVDDVADVIAAATVVRDGGHKMQAKAMVLAAMRLHPRSPAAGEAQAFLKSCR